MPHPVTHCPVSFPQELHLSGKPCSPMRKSAEMLPPSASARKGGQNWFPPTYSVHSAFLTLRAALAGQVQGEKASVWCWESWNLWRRQAPFLVLLKTAQAGHQGGSVG